MGWDWRAGSTTSPGSSPAGNSRGLAIARSLVNDPGIVPADEPCSGNSRNDQPGVRPDDPGGFDRIVRLGDGALVSVEEEPES